MVDDDDDDAFEDLFKNAEARARHTDPHTSHEAAANVDAETLWRKTHRVLTDHGDMTSNTASELLDKRHVCVSPVFAPMERAGLICKAGIEITSIKTKRILWRAIPLPADADEAMARAKSSHKRSKRKKGNDEDDVNLWF